LTLAKQVIEYRERTEQVHAKENGKNPKRNQIFAGGKGRHLTSSESIAAIRADHDARMEAKNQKIERQSNRDRKRVEVARIELEWKVIKELHAEKVKEWAEERARLMDEGTLKKNLPKKTGVPVEAEVAQGSPGPN